jgi:DnaJ family protein C protein 28
LDQWESIAERKIREAIEAGAFDNLPSKGKPIELDTDPDPSLWMAHHLLRVNGFAPAWIEESKDIDAAVDRFRVDLRSAGGRPRSIDELRKRAVELNRRILTYNLKSPSAQVHKWPLDIDAEIRAARNSLQDGSLARR